MHPEGMPARREAGCRLRDAGGEMRAPGWQTASSRGPESGSFFGPRHLALAQTPSRKRCLTPWRSERSRRAGTSRRSVWGTVIPGPPAASASPLSTHRSPLTTHQHQVTESLAIRVAGCAMPVPDPRLSRTADTPGPGGGSARLPRVADGPGFRFRLGYWPAPGQSTGR